MENYQYQYEGYTFKGKREDEEIIFLLHRHWLVLLFRLIPFLFFMIVLTGFHYLGPGIFQTAGLPVSEELFGLVETYIFMILWLVLFVVWVDYYLDVWIVTDQRIIDIGQLGLFRRQVSELEHSKIQDITSEIQGVIPTLFNFGYVYIQTAGERARFEFKQIPNPVEVKNLIMQLQKSSILEEKKVERDIMRGKL